MLCEIHHLSGLFLPGAFMLLRSFLGRFLPPPPLSFLLSSPYDIFSPFSFHSLILHLPLSFSSFSSSYSLYILSLSLSPFHLLSSSSLPFPSPSPHHPVCACERFQIVPFLFQSLYSSNNTTNRPFFRGHTLAVCTSLGFSLLSPSFLLPYPIVLPHLVPSALTEHNNSGVGELSRAELRNASFVKVRP